jgi:hypothetical protein
MNAPDAERLRRLKALGGDLEAVGRASEKVRDSVASGVMHARRSGLIKRQRRLTRTIPKT